MFLLFNETLNSNIQLKMSIVYKKNSKRRLKKIIFKLTCQFNPILQTRLVLTSCKVDLSQFTS